MTSNVFTLEALDAALEKEYAPLRFEAGGEEFVLKSLLRCDKKVRDDVVERLDTLTEDVSEDDVLSTVQHILKSVCADGKGNKLVKILGADLLRYNKLLGMWVEATQPGEAGDSPR